jgi:putative restriction endonuclease
VSQIPDLAAQLRLRAIAHVEELTLRHGERIPYQVLLDGFIFNDERIPLISPRGIFIPGFLRKRGLPEIPLTFNTTAPKAGKPRPYEDSWTGDGLMLHYKYFGEDPQHRDNVGMRSAMRASTPLIYLYGVQEGYYRADWPVFVVGDDPSRLEFAVSTTEAGQLATGSSYTEERALAREYSQRSVAQRLHQRTFRRRVLMAYQQSCCVCKIKHDALLDAAHIIPDSDPRGEPWVYNGMALCKIHHAAFDAKILGIHPRSLFVEIREDVLEEVDGPMLTHGLQELHGRVKASIPAEHHLQPRVEFLTERYEQFMRRLG